MLKGIPASGSRTIANLSFEEYDVRHLREARSALKELVLVDLETTGLDFGKDEIIEIGLATCLYCPETFEIFYIGNLLSMYRQPSFEISEFIQDYTGITNEMVEGKSICLETLDDYLSGDPLLIAHNSSFDRPFFDDQFLEFQDLKWGCSMTDFDWKSIGCDSMCLQNIGLVLGFEFEGHRASNDCYAIGAAMSASCIAARSIIEKSESTSFMIHATKAPFEVKGELSSMGYKWKPNIKTWCKEVCRDDLRMERLLLSDVYDTGKKGPGVSVSSPRRRFKPLRKSDVRFPK